MTYQETSKRPVISETGPRPLTPDQIESNINRFKMGKIISIKSGEELVFFNASGVFKVAERYDHAGPPDHYWSKELLRFDPNRCILQISEYGNLKVYETQGEKFNSHQKKPSIIIKAESIRKIDTLSAKIGKVRQSGFVFPKYFPPYPLGNEQKISQEGLDQILLAEAQLKDQSQSTYSTSLGRGYIKVDASLAEKEVLLLPFDHVIDVNDVMQADAVVIDVAERKLIPRIFYQLDREKNR